MATPQPVSKEEIAKRFANLATPILGVEVDPANLGAGLVTQYGADSMDVVDLTDRAEREFGITIPTEDISNVRTFGDFVEYVSKRLSA